MRINDCFTFGIVGATLELPEGRKPGNESSIIKH
jgi:hypothetical protein